MLNEKESMLFNLAFCIPNFAFANRLPFQNYYYLCNYVVHTNKRHVDRRCSIGPSRTDRRSMSSAYT